MCFVFFVLFLVSVCTIADNNGAMTSYLQWTTCKLWRLSLDDKNEAR